MPDYRFRSVRPDGSVMHQLGRTSASLAEAQAGACQFARSLVAAGPEGKSWSEWCVDVVDTSGRLVLRVPFAMASGEGPGAGENGPNRPGMFRPHELRR